MLSGVFHAEKFDRARLFSKSPAMRRGTGPVLSFLRYPTLISSTVKQRVAWGAMASPAPWAP